MLANTIHMPVVINTRYVVSLTAQVFTVDNLFFQYRRSSTCRLRVRGMYFPPLDGGRCRKLLARFGALCKGVGEKLGIWNYFVDLGLSAGYFKNETLIGLNSVAHLDPITFLWTIFFFLHLFVVDIMHTRSGILLTRFKFNAFNTSLALLLSPLVWFLCRIAF